MIDPQTATPDELREHVQRLQADRERTTAGFNEAEADGFAACCDPLCDGAEQRPVRIIRQTRVVRFGDVDGDWSSPFANMISHSHEWLRFADPADATCPTCGGNSDCTSQERRPYPNIVGAQDALLRVRRTGQFAPTDAAGVIAGAAAAKNHPPTPREALDMRYVNGKIDDVEYARKLEVLGEPLPDALKGD
jgi:hypothetical protein